MDAVLVTRAASSPPVVLESSSTTLNTDQDTGKNSWLVCVQIIIII